ncbi:MAG: Methionyl-tRNA formyltransferase [Candidatus Woesebacteria bacterium]|nr:MAG: Methionyl-tRNA formyltransferase [Candidatus Woesebacteria bacterium]
MGKGRNIINTKIVFFGTPDYVVPILEALHKNFRFKDGSQIIAAVITQAPKPAGRKGELAYSAVDKWAYQKRIPVFYDMNKFLESGIESDLAILASFSLIIPQRVIDSFKKGILNIHPSLLPKFRGASPVQAAIALGKKETGVSIIKLDSLLDHGPIVCQFKEEIDENDTTETLRRRLFERSSQVLVELLPAYLEGKINLKEQDHKKATFCYEIKKDYAFIDPAILQATFKGQAFKGSNFRIQFMKNKEIKASPRNINNFIRAMNPWPCAWTEVKLQENGETKRLKIISSHLSDKNLVLDEVQLEGKNPVTWEQFKVGYPQNSLVS